MKVSKLKYNDILSAPVKRVDASFQLSEGRYIRNLIEGLPFKKITCGEVSKRIFHAGRWKRVYISSPKHGITLLGSASMLKADLSDEKLISRKYTEDIPDKILQAGWILISCSGTIGKCAFTNAQHAGKLASQHVIRLVPNNILGVGYIYAYLASKYGYSLLTQGTFGAVIQHIEPANVESIPIPLFKEELITDINDMILKSATLRDEAFNDLTKVHKFFDDRINPTVKSHHHKISLSSIQANNSRMDAESYESDAKLILDHVVENLNYELLDSFVDEVYTEGIFKREYVEKGVPFIMGSEILKSVPTASKSISRKQALKKSELYVKKGWLLMTCSGSVGDIVYADSHLAEFIYTHDLIRITPKSEDNQFYIYGFLSSKIGKKLSNLFKYGSVIQHVDASQIAKLPIPIFEDIKDEITSLVRDYTEKIEQAKLLELKAISMVEAEIEKWKS